MIYKKILLPILVATTLITYIYLLHTRPQQQTIQSAFQAFVTKYHKHYTYHVFFILNFRKKNTASKFSRRSISGLNNIMHQDNKVFILFPLLLINFQISLNNNIKNFIYEALREVILQPIFATPLLKILRNLLKKQIGAERLLLKYKIKVNVDLVGLFLQLVQFKVQSLQIKGDQQNYLTNNYQIVRLEIMEIKDVEEDLWIKHFGMLWTMEQLQIKIILMLELIMLVNINLLQNMLNSKNVLKFLQEITLKCYLQSFSNLFQQQQMPLAINLLVTVMVFLMVHVEAMLIEALQQQDMDLTPISKWHIGGLKIQLEPIGECKVLCYQKEIEKIHKFKMDNVDYIQQQQFQNRHYDVLYNEINFKANILDQFQQYYYFYQYERNS